jgi:imidazolonepropionase-like amidohydrolase
MKALLRIALFCGWMVATVASSAGAQELALVGGKLYASPDSPPLLDVVVLISGGRIAAVGHRGDIAIANDASQIDCTGKTIVAGFWNSHVHFTQPVWINAASAPAAMLEDHLQDMLTKWGFTTVWDLGSDPRSSLALRHRIDSGEVRGPSILLAVSIYPKSGHPVYIPADVPLPEAATPDEAARWARGGLGMGLDGVKLFTGAYMGNKPVVNMDAAVAKAAVDVAHAAGKPVFAHPQNKAGVDTVIAANVDILAHTVPTEPGYTPEQLAQFKSQGTVLIPTLSLWTTVVGSPAIADRLVQSGVDQLKAFSDNGGRILFGTDVGFTRIYDTSLEYEYMHRALAARDVLAALTTTPAAIFHAAMKGRIATGFDADLVVLDGDPITDVSNLAKVAYTIRAGNVIYRRP